MSTPRVEARATPSPAGSPRAGLPKLLRAALLLIVAAGLTMRLWLIFGVHYFEEDALITLRYAQNLLHGDGWVYNTGERVLGTSSPAWTVVTTLAAAPFPVDVARLILSLLALLSYLGASILLVRRLYRSGAVNPVGVVILVAVLSLHRLVATVSVGGMEASLFLFLVVAAIALSERSSGLAFAVAALATLTRPEGLVLTVALAIVLVLSDRRPRQWLLAVGCYLLVLLPWAVFATAYFGSPIPQSAKAKSGWFGDEVSVARVLWRPSELGTWLVEFSGTRISALPAAGQFVLTTGALVLFSVGAAYAWRLRHRFVMTLALFFLGYVAFFYLGRGQLFPWYLLPPAVAFWAVAAVGAGALTAGRQPRAYALTVALLAFFVLPWAVYLPKVVDAQRFADSVREPAGRWLARCSAPDSTVMLEPLGYVGYYSHRRVLDLAGLVSPQFVQLNATGGVGWPAEEINRQTPDYLVLRRYEIKSNQFMSDSNKPLFANDAARVRFERTYKRAAEFGSTPYSLVIYQYEGVTSRC